MPLRLRLPDPRLGELLLELATRVGAGSQLLAESLSGDQSSREETARRLQSEDQAAEASLHAVLRALSAAFVTPFDRTDVYRVAWSMRVCVARMDAACDELALFHLGDVPTGVTELVKHVGLAADIVADAVPRLTRPGELSEPWIELTRLAKQAGREHRRLLAEVTATPESVSVARLTALTQALWRVQEAFDEVAHALQTVAVKEG